MIVKSDRSRVSDYERCPRLRYWRYHFDGTGIEAPSDLKLDARIGTWVHNGIERFLNGDHVNEAQALIHALACEKEFVDECRQVVDWDNLDDEQKFQINEGGRLVKALVYAWCLVRGRFLRSDGEILAIEQEMNVDFPVGESTVRFMARPDIVWKRQADGEIFIRNLKTVRSPNTTWREQWALDMQTLSEPLAVDKYLNDLGFDRSHTCSGVCIDGLITGEVLEYPKGSGHRYHNTPLLYGWYKAGDEPFGKPEWYPRYEWSCTEPHKMGNGKKCPGGKTHKLGGVTKKSVEEYCSLTPNAFNDGVIAWIDDLLTNDPMLVEEQLVELTPILRSEWHIERWKAQTLVSEINIAEDARVAKGGSHHLDYLFPMHTSGGNCLRPGKCAYYDLCWGSSAGDPYAAGYVRRRPNHPQEGEVDGNDKNENEGGA